MATPRPTWHGLPQLSWPKPFKTIPGATSPEKTQEEEEAEDDELIDESVPFHVEWDALTQNWALLVSKVFHQ